MLPRRFFAVLLIGFVGSVGADVVPWAHERSDLVPDPAIVWGRLDNGFRYAIRPSAEPKGRTSLRLLVLAGSLAETDQQRGYAHFVEHMAFNGTRLFPRETLVAVLQRHGMALGADVNGSTRFDRTIYELELPTSGPAQLQEGVSVLREFADGVSFDPAEVERERGVILQEKKLRDTVGARSQEAFMHFAHPQSRLAERWPIGTEECIQKADAESLRAFYTKWYRADNLVLVAAGDFDPAALARMVEEAFGALPAPTTPRQLMELGLREGRAVAPVGTHHEPEGGPAASYTLFAIRPYTGEDSRAARSEQILRSLAFNAFNVRLDEVKRRYEKKLGVAQAAYPVPLGPLEEATLRIDARAGQWRFAITTAEQELRRAREHGFTSAELEEARKKFIASFAIFERNAANRTSQELAELLTDAIAENRVPTAPKDFAALGREVAERATAESCLRAFREAWGTEVPRLFASGNITARRGVKSLAQAYAASARKRVAAPGAKATVDEEFAYTDFGPAAEVVKRDYLEDLEIHRVEFANGVRLNLKVTPFQDDTVLYRARVGFGSASEPPDQAGLRYVANALLVFGLGRHDQKAVRRLMTGHKVGLDFGVMENAFVFSGNSDTAGAEQLLQLLTAYLVDPGWRREELRGIADDILLGYLRIDSSAAELLKLDRAAHLASHDSRYRRPPQKAVRSVSMTQLRAWLEPQLKAAPLELGVVGDFDVEEMIELASRTLGCVPPRKSAPKLPAVKFVARVDPPKPVVMPAASRHGAVQLTWPLPAEHDHTTEHTVELLAEVLRNRLNTRIRDEMSATYAPQCEIARSDFQPEAGHLIASLTCEPGDTKRLGETIRQIADELAREGVTADELERARQPRLQGVAAFLRNNAVWAGFLSVAQGQPEKLDLARHRTEILTRLTVADVSALAARMLPGARASMFTTIPRQEGK